MRYKLFDEALQECLGYLEFNNDDMESNWQAYDMTGANITTKIIVNGGNIERFDDKNNYFNVSY